MDPEKQEIGEMDNHLSKATPEPETSPAYFLGMIPPGRRLTADDFRKWTEINDQVDPILHRYNH